MRGGLRGERTFDILDAGMRTGYADLPLHNGRAPRWLFERMTQLAREMAVAVLVEEGSGGLLRRLANPVWFQAFGCVLGFDWHSSGVTTTVCGAVKEGLRGVDAGIIVAGGKGAASRKTPAEITAACERLGHDPQPLVYASKISAKVDNSAVQDGYQLYHHSFVFTPEGQWCIVQQGMSDATSMARRWGADNLSRAESGTGPKRSARVANPSWVSDSMGRATRTS